MRWLEAAETLEAAKARVQGLALQSPAEYMILCQETGNKLVINPDAVDLAPGSKDSRFPIWEKPYQDALKEAAPERRAEKVTAAETAIFRRLPESVSSSDGNSETIAIHDALNAVFTIKNEKLNWQRLFQEVLLEHRPQELSRSRNLRTPAGYGARIQRRKRTTGCSGCNVNAADSSAKNNYRSLMGSIL